MPVIVILVTQISTNQAEHAFVSELLDVILTNVSWVVYGSSVCVQEPFFYTAEIIKTWI